MSRRSVLITRPEPGATETASRIRALGFDPVLAPLLRVHGLKLLLPEDQAIQAILATSGNAIPGLAALARSTKLLAVGDATAGRARQAGFIDTESADGDAEDLAILASQRLDPDGAPLVLACGSGHGFPLALALRKKGFRVLRRTVYAVQPVQTLPAAAKQALRSERLSAALFFSAETARRFVCLTRASDERNFLGGIMALAISAPAGMALSLLPWGDLRIAARPNQDELLALLK